VCLERVPLSLVSNIEEIHERKPSFSGLENQGYGRRDQSRCLRGTHYLQMLALTSSKRGGRLVRLRTQTTEIVHLILCLVTHVVYIASLNYLGDDNC
jgi:hypothetical protein